MQLDVFKDGAGDIHRLLAVLYLRADLCRADVIVKSINDPDVVAVLAQRRHGVAHGALMRALDDKGAVVAAEQHVNVGGRPDLRVAHGEGEVGADEQDDAGAKATGAVYRQDAAEAVAVVVDGGVKVPQNVGGAAVQRAASVVDARGLPVVDVGGEALDGEGAHLQAVVSRDEGGLVVRVAECVLARDFFYPLVLFFFLLQRTLASSCQKIGERRTCKDSDNCRQSQTRSVGRGGRPAQTFARAAW